MKQKLVKESGAKPKRRIVKADYALNVKGRIFVVPGTGIFLFQKCACDILGNENTKGINASAEKEGSAFQQSGKRF